MRATGFKHLYDYCPRVEELIERLRHDSNGDEEFLMDRNHLLNLATHHENRFSKFTFSNKPKVGDAVSVLEQLFFDFDASSEVVKAVLLMAKALLKDKNPEAYPFLENFYGFIETVSRHLSEKRSAS